MSFYNFLVEEAKTEGIELFCVGAVIDDDSDDEDCAFLLLKRPVVSYMGGIWELPSGKVEDGEGLEEALLREVKEETGLDVDEVICYVGHFDYESKKSKRVRQFNFAVDIENCAKVVLSEHDEFKWMSLEEALAHGKISNNVKKCLRITEFNFIGE